LVLLLLLKTIVVASVTSGNVPEAMGDNTQTTVTGRLVINYPEDYPASYYLIDSLGEIQLIPSAAGVGPLYQYEGATIEATGNLVTQDGQRILYMETWAPVGVSAAAWDPITVTGTQRVLLILATFSDINYIHLPSYIQERIYNGSSPSMRLYFEEDSYNIITVTGNPTRWYTLAKSNLAYNIFTWESCGKGDFHQFAEDVIKLVDADPSVNFALYNHFMIVGTRNWHGDGVWGCRLGSDFDTNHGVIHGLSVVSEDDYLSTYVHEFSHDLGQPGLPDLYDYTDPKDPYEFIDGWDPMGGWSGWYPQHHSAFSKMRFSWIPSQRVANFDLAAVNNAPGGRLQATFTIDRIETPTSGVHALRIGTNPQSSNKYFLVETRQKVGYDVNLPNSLNYPNYSPSPDHGLLITYVDRDKGNGEGIVRLVDPYGGSTDQNPTTQQKDDGDAVWQVGQTYVNSYYGFAVAVQSWTCGSTCGFVVTVTAPHVLYAVNFRAVSGEPPHQVDLPQGLPGVPDSQPTVDYQIDTNPGQGVAPFSVLVEPGHTIRYNYRTTVYANSSVHFEFVDDDHDGLPVTVEEDWFEYNYVFPPGGWATTITANYKAQYSVGFAQTGVGSDFTDVPGAVVVTIDGTGFVHSGFWWDDQSIHSFSFESPLVVAFGPDANVKQYVWDSTSGLSTLQSTNAFSVTGSGSVTGNYRTQYYLTLQTQPTGVGGAIEGEGWYYSGTSARLDAPRGPFDGPKSALGALSVCGEDYYFDYWDVDGQRRVDLLTGLPCNPISVSMNGPHTATAHYSACGLLLTSGPKFIPTNTPGTWTASLTLTAAVDLWDVTVYGGFNSAVTVRSVCVDGVCSSSVSSPAGGFGPAAADLSPTVLGSTSAAIFTWPSMPAGTSHTITVTMQGSFSYPGTEYLTHDWSVTANSQSGPISLSINDVAIAVECPPETTCPTGPPVGGQVYSPTATAMFSAFLPWLLLMLVATGAAAILVRKRYLPQNLASTR
jgi:M6 family metalloprotease-like protein